MASHFIEKVLMRRERRKGEFEDLILGFRCCLYCLVLKDMLQFVEQFQIHELLGPPLANLYLSMVVFVTVEEPALAFCSGSHPRHCIPFSCPVQLCCEVSSVEVHFSPHSILYSSRRHCSQTTLSYLWSTCFIGLVSL